MKIKEYIKKIVDNGKQEDMEELSDMLEEVMYKLKEYNEDCYEKYKMKLYVMANGEVLTEEMAYDIVDNMKPNGEHWSIEETSQVKNQNGLSMISDIDFYVVMNMAWNDYHNVFGDDVNMYVNYSKAFILDEDAKKGKVFIYFTEIPKKM